MKFYLLLLLVLFVSCSEFNGSIQTNDQPIDPIASAIGNAIIEPGRFTKLPKLKNPKVAFVWQEMDGAKINRHAIDMQSSVEPAMPFSFTSDLLENPPAYMFDTLNIFAGAFFLYSDNNNNGKLDVLYHPNLEPYRDTIANLKENYRDELNHLLTLSNITDNTAYGEAYTETPDGSFIFITETGLDSSFHKATSVSSLPLHEVNFRKRQILQHLSRWENFMGARANLVFSQAETSHHKDIGKITTHKFYRRLFPKIDHEAEFKMQLYKTAIALAAYDLKMQWIRSHRISEQWNNYMYTPSDDQDWISGRSIWNYIFYIYNEQELNEVKGIVALAKTMGTTLISNLEDFKLGYNFLECNENYNCKILAPTDPITLFLGDEACYLESCQAEMDKLEDIKIIQLPDSITRHYSGSYQSIDSATTINIVKYGTNTWLQYNNRDIFVINPAARTILFNSLQQIEVEFAIDSTSNSIYVTQGNEETQLHFSHSTATNLDLINAISEITTTPKVDLSPDIMALYQGQYQLSSQENMHVINKESSIKVTIPGVGFFSLEPIAQDTFCHRESNTRITFERNRSGTITKLTYHSPSKNFSAPSINYVPQTAGSLNSDFSDNIPRDTIHGSHLLESDLLNNSYTCLTDLLALSQNDRGIDSIVTFNPLAPLFSHTGDALLFKIDQSSENFGLTLKGCPNQTEENSTIRIKVSGGPSPYQLNDFIQDEVTATFLQDGSYFSVSPILTGGQVPYFVKIEFFSMYTGTAPIVFDSYIITQAVP
ncbi:MAG: hypothetical protein OCC49_07530 [Fibrobacterales bacterium]